MRRRLMQPADAYERESQRLCRQATATACLLGIPLVPAFAVLDAVVFPARFTIFLEMRLACVGTLGIILLLVRRPFGERHALGLGMMVALNVGLMIDAMTVMTGGHASPYYAGVNLVILTVALVMPWRAAWAASACAVLVGGYVAGALAVGPITEARMFVNNLFFLVSTAIIAVVGAAVREGLRRREFFNRLALTDALRQRNEFLAKMTHELRTPIHVMVGYSDMLLEDGLGDEAAARSLVERIRSQGVLLRDLVSDLLDYSKMEAGKLEVRREPVAVRQIVDQVAESFRPLSERGGLRLRTVYRSAQPAMVTDRHKVLQILNNLVGNALKFTPTGEITIEVSGRVDPWAMSEFVFLAEPADFAPRDGVLVLVRDTGIGIREEDIPTLAADFQQLDADAAARYGGTGLGLSISKKLAQLLGGWLAVRSRRGEGTTFAVFLPSLGGPEREEPGAGRSAA